MDKSYRNRAGIYDNTVKHVAADVPGRPTGDGDTTEQPSDSGATSTKVQEPPATALTEGPDAAAAKKFTAPPTSPLTGASPHMPGFPSK